MLSPWEALGLGGLVAQLLRDSETEWETEAVVRSHNRTEGGTTGRHRVRMRCILAHRAVGGQTCLHRDGFEPTCVAWANLPSHLRTRVGATFLSGS
jgi:hypothetical protein